VDSVTVVLDDGGKIVTQHEYLPFGETWITEGDKKNAPKYNSQEMDRETGYYFYNARHYDAEIGRFVTADNIVPDEYSTQSWNRYSYCRNNPIIYKDPTGHLEVSQILDYIGEKLIKMVGDEPRKWAENYISEMKAKEKDPQLVPAGGKDTANNKVADKTKKAKDKVVDSSTKSANADNCEKLATNNNIDLPLADKDKSTYTAYKNGISSDYLAYEEGRRKPINYGPHNGIDMPAPVGTSIYSTTDGIVTKSGIINGYGRVVEVEGADGKKYLYAHNSSNSVKVTDEIKKGQKIAEVGSLGISTGAHVHYEVRDKNGNTLNPYDHSKKFDDEKKAIK
jgi:RHS repeat-associated protein